MRHHITVTFADAFPHRQGGGSSGNTDNTFRVLFETNGGSPISPVTFLSYGVVAKPKDPTKTGYAFGGWYTDPARGQKAWNFANGITGDMTLYAAWIGGPTVTGTAAITATTTITATVSTVAASPRHRFGQHNPHPNHNLVARHNIDRRRHMEYPHHILVDGPAHYDHPPADSAVPPLSEKKERRRRG